MADMLVVINKINRLHKKTSFPEDGNFIVLIPSMAAVQPNPKYFVMTFK